VLVTMRLFPRSFLLLGLVPPAPLAGHASSRAPARGHDAAARDMEPVGHHDLQGRAAYQPTLHAQDARGITSIGHNVEADDRGLVSLADHANTALHIVKLTGAAARIAGRSRA